MASIKVPLFVPDLDEAEEEAVLDCLKSKWLAMGPRCERFEAEFSAVSQSRHAVSVNSCTAALHLAIKVLDIGDGDEVIVPSLTFAATANAVVYCGASPVFVDVESEDDWTISPYAIEVALSEKTKAIVVMHYAGYPCDMDAITKIAARHSLPVIEDACHGLGGSIGGKPMGSVGEMGCFSFYSNKVMTTGEGGMLITNSTKLRDRLKRLRSHGMTAGAYDRMKGAMGYDIEEIGYNYRMDDIRASIGIVQLGRLEQSVLRRNELVNEYRERLKSIKGVSVPVHGDRGRPAHYIFPVLLDKGIDRDKVRATMLAAGVQTSIHYPPAHLFTHYRESAPELPVTEDVASRMITLPLYPQLEEQQVDLVCEALKAAIFP